MLDRMFYILCQHGVIGVYLVGAIRGVLESGLICSRNCIDDDDEGRNRTVHYSESYIGFARIVMKVTFLQIV